MAGIATSSNNLEEGQDEVASAARSLPDFRCDLALVRPGSMLTLQFALQATTPTHHSILRLLVYLSSMFASVKTLLSMVAAVAMLQTGHVADAWDGSVTLYQDANFRGAALKIKISTSQRCFNVGCFNDRASSITWEGLPTKGNYGGSGIPYVVVYEHKNCGGSSQQWYTTTTRFPDNLQKGSMNDRITSFIIWEDTSFKTQGDFDVCPFARANVFGLDGGNDSVTIVSESDMTPTVVGSAVTGQH